MLSRNQSLQVERLVGLEVVSVRESGTGGGNWSRNILRSLNCWLVVEGVCCRSVPDIALVLDATNFHRWSSRLLELRLNGSGSQTGRDTGLPRNWKSKSSLDRKRRGGEQIWRDGVLFLFATGGMWSTSCRYRDAFDPCRD